MSCVYVQKCWSCKNACHEDNCIWVRTLNIKPEGVKLDNKGYIVECPNYEHDNKLYTEQEKAKAVGLTFKEYLKIKRLLAYHGLTLSVAEYLEKTKETKETVRELAKSLGAKRYYDKVKNRIRQRN